MRFALRTLLQTPVVTLVAVISLALGVGANTAMFSILQQVLLRTLPVTEPERLVFLYHPGPLNGRVSSDEADNPSFSYPLYTGLRKAQTPFTGLAGGRSFDASISYRNQPYRGRAHLVTGNYFQVLGLRPAMGRLLSPADDGAPGANPVVVLSYRYWSLRLGAEAGVLNSTILVNGYPMTVVGVVQKGFNNERLGATPEVLIPVAMKAQIDPERADLTNRLDHWMPLFGRLKPGLTLEAAQRSLQPAYQAEVEQDILVIPKLTAASTQRYRAKRLLLKPGAMGRAGAIRNEARTIILLLFGITGMVLLIACANVANLQLARSAARAREIAVRMAMGATRVQMLRQLLIESWLLAGLSGAAGLLVAQATLRFMVSSIPANSGVVLSDSLDWSMLAFTLLLSLATGVTFGLAPALCATRPDLVSILKDQAGQASGGASSNRFRKTLATAQLAISLALLVTAGLFGKSLVNLLRIDLGIRTDHLISFTVAPKLNRYADDRIAPLYEQIQLRLAAIPGAALVTAASIPVIAGSNSSMNITVAGYTASKEDDNDSSYSQVGENYFRAFGVPLLAGREFTAADNRAGQKVAVVNEAFVRHFFGNGALHDGTAVGTMFAHGNGKPDVTIVGVARDSKYAGIQEKPIPVFYRPYRQAPRPPALYFYVRTHVDPPSIAPQIRQAVASLDPNLPLTGLKTMEAQIDENLFAERLMAQLITAFAMLAILLTAIGLYGVLAYNVALRTREIGIRMALGAASAQVHRLVLGEVLVMIMVGGAAGIAGAVVIGRVAGSLLYGMTALDPIVYLGAVSLLAVVAFAATYAPAMRATRVDPIRALRYE